MIYICIPAHNEERTVGVLLWKIRQVMAGFPRDYQLLVADDGSTDDTAEVLGPYQRVLPLTVVKLDRRSGYASALELLMREAVRRAEYPKRDVIVTLQADFTDDPDELLALLKRIEAGADIVAANAALPALAPRSLRWPRQVGNYMLRKRVPEAVADPLGGLRAYRVMVVKRALEGRNGGRLLTWDGWAANSELLQLTQPHSRRTEAIDAIYRGDRQQRPSRNRLWPLLLSVLSHARGGVGPLANLALPVPASTDSRERRKPGRRAHGRKDGETREVAVRERRNGRGSERGNGRGHGHEPAGRPRRERGPAAHTETAEAAETGRSRKEGRKEGRPRREEGRPQRDGRARGEKRRRPAKPERPPLEQPEAANGAVPPEIAEVVDPTAAAADEVVRKSKRRRRKRRRGGRSVESEAPEINGGTAELPDAAEVASESPDDAEPAEAAEPVSEGGTPPARKRRSRRGGRGRRGRRRAPGAIAGSTQEGGEIPAGESNGPAAEPPPAHSVDSETN